MFGNKYKGDEIAKELKSLLASSKLTKKAQDFSQEAKEAFGPEEVEEEEALNPEDFLVSSDDPSENDRGLELDESIENLASYADDMCMAHDTWFSNCGCDKEAKPKQESDADDFSYLVDRKAKYVLYGLGKIARSLKDKGENFAADVVEATAISIKNDLIKEAKQKATVIKSLASLSSDLKKSGDRFGSDMVEVTIAKIKENK